MNVNRNRTSRLSLFARAAVPGWMILSLASLPALAQTARDQAALEATDWLSEKAAWYEEHPELKTQRGTGWKPYNRAKWFYEQRTADGQPVPIGARYLAWEERNRIEAALPRSTRATWFSLGPANLAGRILALEFDPNDANVLYAGTAGGGLWKSTDAGVSWLNMSDETPSLAVGGVAVLPSNSNVVLMGTGEGTFNIDRIAGVGVLKSTDGGVTWGVTDLDYAKANGHGFHFLKASPSTGTLLGGATDGLWRSTDAGDTWTQVESGASFYDAVWKPSDPSRIYVIRGGANNPNNGVKVSTDDGATFTIVGTGQPVSESIGKSKLAVSEQQPTWIYLGVSHRSNSSLVGIYRSTNDGATWTLQANTPNMYGGQGWYNVSLVADPNDANRVFSGGIELYRSTNGGVTFNEVGSGTVHVDHHAAAYQPGSPNDVFVGSDGGIWESTNDGGQWIDRNAGLVTYQFYDICVAQTTTTFMMGGTQDQGTDRWTGTTTWTQGLGADGMVCNVSPTASNVIYAEIQGGDHRKSTNGGTSFFAINNGITGNGSWVTPVAEDQTPGNANHLYTASSTGIFRTTNGGTNWVNVRSGNATWIDISPVNGNHVWTVQGSSNARFSTDDGGTWAFASPYGFQISGATKVLADPVDLNTVFVTFGSYNPASARVARTTDLGATWTNVSGNLPAAPVNAIAVDPEDNGRWFVGTDVGIWESTDGGTTWVPFDDGFPNTVVADLEIQKSGRKMVAGTHGRGAWEVDIGVTGTSVDVAVPEARNLMFDPPSPNPAIRETLLRFAAKSTGEVTLTVYDVTGRQVSELARASAGDGIIRTVSWLTDDVPSGVYFAVLKAGSEQLSRKIVVAK